MLVRAVEIENYKSYRRSGPIKFEPGFNAVVGQNNSGKTALLEAISTTHFSGRPHKQLAEGRPKIEDPYSRVNLEISVSGPELRALLLSRGGQHLVPVPAESNFEISKFFDQAEIVYSVNFITDGRGWRERSRESKQTVAVLNVTEDHSDLVIAGYGRSDSQVFSLVVEEFASSVFLFRAERLSLTSSSITDKARLAPNADNLANVILHLQTGSPTRFKRLNAYLHQIFPSIHGVSAKVRGGQAHLHIWSIDPTQEYEQLSADLANSGTGVGQAIAILSIVVDSDFPRIIIIDEPNSFLHPAAVRTLLRILKTHNHQYIVSTHAAEVIAISEPSTLHQIRWDDGQSIAEVVSAREIKNIRRVLSDLGVRLSEVFGADEILWVEGQTEQECFPHLLNFSGVPPRSGLSIVAVRATGDFETGRVKAAAIWEIYDRLSRGNALLAPAVAFSFDREGRSEEDIRDLQRRSGAVVHFLPRRMYENYLIAPKAIVAVVNRTAERKIAEEDVLQWLQVNGGNPIYEARNNWRNDPYDLDWLKNVRGAKLLSDLFSSLSAATVEYRKPFHSIELTEWLLEKEPDHLAGVVEYVKSLVAVD